MASIESSRDNDTIIASAEGDSIVSWGFRTSIVGSSGNDTIRAGGFLSTVDAGDGENFLIARRSYIILQGGSDHDILQINSFSWNENIANVSLFGGAGEDGFSFAPYYDETNQVWRRILHSEIMDFNADEGDYIILHNIDPNEQTNLNAYTLNISRYTDRSLGFSDYYDRVSFKMTGVTRFSDIAQTYVGFNDADSGERLLNSTFEQRIPFIDMGSGIKSLNRWLFLNSTLEGDIQLNDDSFWYIDAVEDSVSGRALIGNDYDNWIYAGDYGNKLWGRSGSENYLIGGEGADTFYAGQGEGNAFIYLCDDDDVVKLWNVTAGDLASVSYDTFEGYDPEQAGAFANVNIHTTDETWIMIARPEGAKTLTVQLADSTTFRFDYDNNAWEQIRYNTIAPPSLTETTEGLMTFMNTVVIGSTYEGEVRLANFDDTLLANISAVNDTVEGRVLIGDSQDNVIHAGTGGASLYGGTGGSDTLRGGDGADTFVAGQGEGNTFIRAYGSEDIVYLRNVVLSDLKSLFMDYNNFGQNFALITTNDDTNFNIISPYDDSAVTIVLDDRSTIRCDFEENTWQRTTNGSSWSNITEVNGNPVGVTVMEDVVYILRDYDGDFSLANYGDGSYTTASAVYDMQAGRHISGSTLDNSIVANDYGSWLYGGEGYDTLLGGNGVDTFEARMSEGSAYIRNYDSSDIIYLSDIAFSDFRFLHTETNSYGRIFGAIQMDDGTYVDVINPLDSSTMTATILLGDNSTVNYDFNDNTWQRTTNGMTWNDITSSDDMFVGVYLNQNNVVYLFPEYEGTFNIADLNDSSLVSVTAYYDTLSGRHINGDSQNNRVRASDTAGSWLYGGDGGNDTLVGGGGNDTFEARMGEGYTMISLCSANDVVYLSNVNFSDIQYLNISANDTDRYTNITTSDGTYIEVNSLAEESSTTIVLADNSTLRYNAADNEWQRRVGSAWSKITSVGGAPIGLYVSDDVAYVYRDFDGNFSLSSLNDSVVTGIAAFTDNLSGRVLIGDDQANRIYANDYGSSLWGGGSGADTLYGGEGNDTFRVGQGEDTIQIFDCKENDVVHLWNVNFEDVSMANVYVGSSYKNAGITTSDGTYIVTWSQLDEPTTTFQFADGAKLRYNATDNVWQQNIYYSGAWQAVTSLSDGLSFGLELTDSLVYVYSDYAGDFKLADLNNSSIVDVYASNDTLSGRVLVGDDQDNVIYAGTGGASLYGGGGADLLSGGAGDDTFVADISNGTTDIINCSSDDLVVLTDVSSTAVLVDNTVDVIAYESEFGTAIAVAVSDSVMCDVFRTTGATTTTFELSDGVKLQYDYSADTWQPIYGSTSNALDELLSDASDDEPIADSSGGLTSLLNFNLKDLVVLKSIDDAPELVESTGQNDIGSSLIMKYASIVKRQQKG